MNTEESRPAGAEDEIDFFEDNGGEPEIRKTWKLMTVDDEPDVHEVTRLALADYEFDRRRLEFVCARSGREAMRLIRENPDTAVILLDVVMETEHAGLDVVRYIRQELGNSYIRIILRTAHPGQAPEKDVVMNYDINDYREKGELTVQRLYTAVTSALRSYRDLKTIDRNRRGLELIIRSSSRLFEIQSLKDFARGVLEQLLSILNLDESSVYIHASGFTATAENKEELMIMAGTGDFVDCVDKPVGVLHPNILRLLQKALENRTSYFQGDTYVGYFSTATGSRNLLYIKGCRDLTELDEDLIRIFSSNVSVAFENIYLNKEILETQKEIIFTLGEVVENRCQETANHVRRVAEYSYELAKLAGLDEDEADLIRIASPLHDIGKVGIPDSILFKTGRLTAEEFGKIMPHPDIGYNILKNSNREIIEAAAIIARQHHERWNGKGYPLGLKGEEIHIYGRICGLADVFDALCHKRVYKKSWEMDEVLQLLREEKGEHFDPHLTDIFLDNINIFTQIKDRFKDR